MEKTEVKKTDEEYVQEMCRKIFMNVADVDDDILLTDIEEGIEGEGGYTQKDYRTLLMNTLKLYEEHTKQFSSYYIHQENLIRHLFMKIFKYNEAKIDISDISYDDNGDIDILETINYLNDNKLWWEVNSRK